MKQFQVGDWVGRISGPAFAVSRGKVYQVLETRRGSNDAISLVNDNGHIGWYSAEYFEHAPRASFEARHYPDVDLLVAASMALRPSFKEIHNGASLANAAPMTAKAAEKQAATIVAAAAEQAEALVQAAAKALEDDEVLKRSAAERKALHDRIAFERELATATYELLGTIRNLLDGSVPQPAAQSAYAKYRKELQPLASTYGVKITLVGDKTRATLVLL